MMDYGRRNKNVNISILADTALDLKTHCLRRKTSLEDRRIICYLTFRFFSISVALCLAAHSMKEQPLMLSPECARPPNRESYCERTI